MKTFSLLPGTSALLLCICAYSTDAFPVSFATSPAPGRTGPLPAPGMAVPGEASAPSATDRAAARAFARLLLGHAAVDTVYYDTYFEPDGRPHAHLFTASPSGTSDRATLTLAVGPRAGSPLLFYYFAGPFDAPFRGIPGSGAGSRVVVTGSGLMLETAERSWRIPAPADFPAGVEVGGPILSPPGSGDGPRYGPNEYVIPGVPIYLWYLNCALTSETMVLAYWADRLGTGLVPGGDSVNGRYFAITEELTWLNDRTLDYVGAAEFGYRWGCARSTLPDKAWSTYVAAIQSGKGPLLVTWNGPPYGAHSTVAVGYRELDGQRFLVLHDTWISSRAYVNFDAYSNSIIHFGTFELTGTNGFDPGTPVAASRSEIALTPTNLVFSPALSSSEQGWHSFEAADFNGDGRQDLLVCGFRNNYATSARLALYTNDHSRFVWDSRFAPGLIHYECVHVARACDFDRDGDVDAAVTGYWLPIRVYTNSAAGLGSQAIVVGSENNSYGYTDVAWGDIDRDGDADLAATTANPIPGPGKIRVYAWQAGGFTKVCETGVAEHTYSALKLRDLNRDGSPEILCANRRGSVVVYLNAAGQFANPPWFAPAQGHGAMAVDAGDIDGDGYAEIVTVDDGTIVVFDNGPGGLAAAPVRLQTAGKCYAKDVVLADLNQDGFPELLVANYNTPSAVFRNCAGVFDCTPLWLSANSDPAVRVHVFAPGEDPRPTVAFSTARGAVPGFYRVSPVPVLGIGIDDAGPVLSLENLRPGLSYVLERSAGLPPAGWEGVHRFRSTCSTTNWADATQSREQFYRARLE